MDIKLIYHLIAGAFSQKKGNMRFFSIRRILIVLILFPVFVLILITNRIFLLLDYILVPFFYFQKIKAPVFIVAAPRSGTTFLYHSIAKYTNMFTCFKLWEIVFAPSVIQKCILLVIKKLDSLIGSPLKKMVLFVESLLVGNLKTVHLLGLNLPEEDEGLLLWNLSSIYLNFFYPDSTFFDRYLYFDKDLPAWRRKWIMRSYHNYLKRHNFVFNRKGTRQFLSKNPLMMCKLVSLKEQFPDAIILNINRCPSETIPSTIALNNTLYGLFTSIAPAGEVNDKTKKILIDWYRMADEALAIHYKEKHLKIDFYQLVQNNQATLNEIRLFLGMNEFEPLLKESEVKHQRSKNKYEPLMEPELAEIMLQMPFMKPYARK